MMAGIPCFGCCEGRIACLFELIPEFTFFWFFFGGAFVALAVDEAWKEGQVSVRLSGAVLYAGSARENHRSELSRWW